MDFRLSILDFRFSIPQIANRKSQTKNVLCLASCILCLVVIISVLASDGLAYSSWASGHVETRHAVSLPSADPNNAPPVASNLKISPPYPTTADSLVASYDYSDPDDDQESGSDIIWYKDDSQTDYEKRILSASATSKGQKWYFTVRPKDAPKPAMMQSRPK